MLRNAGDDRSQASMSPSVVRGQPRRDVVARSVSSDQGADDFVERLGLAGLVVKAGATADQSTADDSGGTQRPAREGTDGGRADTGSEQDQPGQHPGRVRAARIGLGQQGRPGTGGDQPG